MIYSVLTNWIYHFSFFFFYIFYLNIEKEIRNCCVGFCHVTVQISHSYACIPFLCSLPPLPPAHPTRSSQSTRLDFLCNFSPAIHLMSDSVYMLMLLPSFIPLSPSPTVSTSPFSTSVSPSSPCKQIHQYHFSKFHTYVLIYCNCFPLSDILHCLTGPRSIHFTRADSNSFFFYG